MNIKKTTQAMRIFATAKYTLFLIISVVAIGSFTLRAQAVEIQPLTSPSGIKAYLVENYTSPIITMSFSFNGGTAQDPVGQEGVTNLLTTMLDEGAGNIDGPQFQALSEKIGMELSFNADRDYFSSTLQTLAENSTQAFDMLRLALNEPRFDSPSLERMRQAIVKNLERAKNSPRRIASIAMREALFDGHPYARPNNGTIDSVTALTREDLAQIHRRLFARDGLVIGVVGAISKEELGAVIDKVFGALPQDSQLNQISEANLEFGSNIQKELDIKQSIVSMALPGVKRDDPDFFAAYLANHILGGGTFSSRLYNEVREKRGLAYSVYSHIATYSHAAFTLVGTATDPKRADDAIKIIRAELQQMADKGPSAEELQAAKKYIIGSYAIKNLDTSAKVAGVLVAIQQINLGIDYIDRREDLINSVTLEEVRRIAEKLLRQEPTLVEVGPIKS